MLSLRRCGDCGSVAAMRILGRLPLVLQLGLGLSGLVLDGVVWQHAVAAEIPGVASRQRAEKKSFTDGEIVDGFLKTAFGAEYHLAGRVDRIRKYDAPVRVFADGKRADRKAELAKVVADISYHIQHLDIAMADKGEDANVSVKLVHDRDLYRTIVSEYGRDRAREIRTSLDPQ